MMDQQPRDAFAAFREMFPGTAELTYLDVAARGLISRPVRQAVDDYLDVRMQGRADKAWMFEQAEGARAGFARLINAEADEIALIKNVSEGINAVACAVDWRPGDNVVLCESLEHPANIFPWRNVAHRSNLTIKSVVADDGRIDIARIADAIDGRTRVVAIASVSFAPGFRAPLAELGSLCRERGVLLVVDGAQSEGILTTDVEAMKIDALATSSQKGLLALYGGGFLYVRRAVAEALSPGYLSRAGVALASGHEASTGDPEGYQLAPSARRFDVGNHNFLAAIALEQSLGDLAALEIANVEVHCVGLARQLAVNLRELGLPILGDPVALPSHIVAVGRALSDSHDTSDDTALIALHDFLMANSVRLTIRRGILRFSFHAYNALEDVERVSDLARIWLRRERSNPFG
ncbi:MAG: aminotransferase class V-fold PLP-dependent enzyme [Hyphomicrobiaceae bacterium]